MGFGMMDGSGFMSGWGWGGMAFGSIMMLLWFALIISLIVFLFRWISGSSQRNSNQDALDILQQRYARGEVDASELEERSAQLRRGK
jgi:putative membrane protein